MARRANPALVGGFVMVALALALATTLYFGTGTYGDNWYRFHIYFKGSAAGLQVGAPVVLKGVRIGQVSSVQVGFYPEDEDFIVPVEIEIDGNKILWSDTLIAGESQQDPLQKLINLGLRARLDMQSLVTGQLRVDLGFYPDTEVVLRGRERNGLEIPAIPSTLDELIDAVQSFPIERLAASSLRVIEGLDRLINSPRLTEILDGASATVTDARAAIGALRARTDPAADKLLLVLDQLQQLVERGQVAVDSANLLFDSVGGDARTLLRNLNSGLQPALASMRQAAGSAQSAFKAADSAFRSTNELIGSESPLRHELLTLMRNLTDAARSLRIMSDYLERHPDALLRGKR
ncbi:MAG: MCE family protein [Gammaproteobacteria bacterium]|nr:MCE family protein [Gammaproteobacteria bacterium]